MSDFDNRIKKRVILHKEAQADKRAQEKAEWNKGQAAINQFAKEYAKHIEPVLKTTAKALAPDYEFAFDAKGYNSGIGWIYRAEAFLYTEGSNMPALSPSLTITYHEKTNTVEVEATRLNDTHAATSFKPRISAMDLSKKFVEDIVERFITLALPERK